MNQALQTAKAQWLAGFALAAATFLAYWPALRGDFVWDDNSWTMDIVGRLQNAAGLWAIWSNPLALQQYYPLAGTSFWLDYHLWHFWTLPYHVENVLLHLLAVFLLWRLLRQLELPAAWLAAALFALHPVMVESVAWITERKNVLSLVFYLAALLAYLRSDPSLTRAEEGKSPAHPGASRFTHHASRWYLLALVLFLCALLAKTTAFSLPAVFLLLAWWRRGRLQWQADVLPTLPFFALSLSLCAVTGWMEKNHVGAQGPDFALSFAQRCLVAGRAFWFYLGQLLWPAHLCFVYPRWQPNPTAWWQWLLPATAVGLLLALWLARKRIGRGPLAALLFYVGTLFPLLGFLNAYGMRYSFVWDHWVYLPSLGPLILAAALIERGMQGALGARPAILHPPSSILCLLPLALAVLTWREAGTFADMQTLWRTTLARNPNCWMAYNNLGLLLASRGKWDEAIQDYEQALRTDPVAPEACYNLGVALATQGKWTEAILHYQRALQLNPDNAQAECNWGAALTSQGQWAEAVQHCERALQLKPDYAQAHCNLGIALAALGKSNEAILQYQRALQLNPDLAEAHDDLGNALFRQGDLTEATQHYRLALQLKPDYALAHCNLAAVLAVQGKWTEAVQHGQRAIQLEPDNVQAQNNLGYALAAQGQWTEAILHYQRALQLKPDFAEAHCNYGAALAAQGKWAEAVPQCQRALQLAPDDAEACEYLGVALAGQGKLNEAIPEFQQALKLATAQRNATLAAAARARLQSLSSAPPP
ncbi:MAG: tetratricopeptide repeat protein [Verrucomicrobiota bacterium]